MPRLLSKDEALSWTREHGQRVNAGDAAAILYEDPYQSAYQLWARKMGRIPPKEQTDEMKSGNVTEGAVFAWYEQRTGLKGLSQVWGAYSDAEWIQSKIDFWHPESKHLAEFKSPFRDDSKDHVLMKSGVAPYHYWLQCQHEMQVMEVEKMTLVSWRSPSDFAILEIKRDDDFWATVMLPAYLEFYRRLTENEWPRPDGNCEMADEEWAMQSRRLHDAKLMRLEAQQQMDRAEAAIKRIADGTGAKRIKGGGIEAVWTVYKPRWEVAVKAESKEALDAIMAALKPLEGRQGVKEIKPREIAANLVLRIGEG